MRPCAAVRLEPSVRRPTACVLLPFLYVCSLPALPAFRLPTRSPAARASACRLPVCPPLARPCRHRPHAAAVLPPWLRRGSVAGSLIRHTERASALPYLHTHSRTLTHLALLPVLSPPSPASPCPTRAHALCSPPDPSPLPSPVPCACVCALLCSCRFCPSGLLPPRCPVRPRLAPAVHLVALMPRAPVTAVPLFASPATSRSAWGVLFLTFAVCCLCLLPLLLPLLSGRLTSCWRLATALRPLFVGER